MSGTVFAFLALTAIALAVVVDAGSVDVQVSDKTQYAADTTNAGAIVEYIGDDNETFGASGTGTFESFLRVQASGNDTEETGYNTDGTLEFDSKAGKWTHTIKISEIPVVSCESLDGNESSAGLCWELFADINEGNSVGDPYIQLNDLEVWFTDDPNLTGYAFGTDADLVYDFEGTVEISDVNQGSGRGDLRYLIPLSGITVPADCGLGDPACDTYFVLYTGWSDVDGGFEEWKVKSPAFVSVTKTAETTFTRTFEWDIDKSVTPATWDLFSGDSGTSDYTVDVTKTGFTDSAWAVSGTITIENTSDQDAVVTSVDDLISADPDDIVADVDCGVDFATETVLLEPEDTLICTYESDLPDGEDRVNTALVELDSGAVTAGQASVIFGDPSTSVNDTVNVTDDVQGDLGSTSSSTTFNYSRTFTCDGDEGTHDNTATIVETGQSDDASVAVDCHDLEVTKDADTSLTRTWTWDIDKSADQTELLLSEGQLFQVNYTIVVSATSQDSAWAVSGNISVDNPAPIDATINGVADIVSPAIVADVDCGVTFPYTLAAGGTLNCTYTADLPDASGRTNTATATLQNHDYDSAGVGTPSGTTDYSGTANVDFANATIDEVDECIVVSDSNSAGPQNVEVCAGDLDGNGEYEFTYSLWFGASPDADVVLECGENTHPNIATFLTNDTQTTGSDDHTVDVTVECVQGCTLTPGYWKTHNDSFHGGAPTDDTWGLLSLDGENTIFFLSGQTYFEVLWTPPKGNAYYNLSFQYIAAELNMLNGASVPTEVQTAFDQATALFNTYTPEYIATLKGNPADKALRQQFITLAGILGQYNEGDIGPGHCSEDGNSA